MSFENPPMNTTNTTSVSAGGIVSAATNVVSMDDFSEWTSSDSSNDDVLWEDDSNSEQASSASVFLNAPTSTSTSSSNASKTFSSSGFVSSASAKSGFVSSKVLYCPVCNIICTQSAIQRHVEECLLKSEAMASSQQSLSPPKKTSSLSSSSSSSLSSPSANSTSMGSASAMTMSATPAKMNEESKRVVPSSADSSSSNFESNLRKSVSAYQSSLLQQWSAAHSSKASESDEKIATKKEKEDNTKVGEDDMEVSLTVHVSHTQVDKVVLPSDTFGISLNELVDKRNTTVESVEFSQCISLFRDNWSSLGIPENLRSNGSSLDVYLKLLSAIYSDEVSQLKQQMHQLNQTHEAERQRLIRRGEEKLGELAAAALIDKDNALEQMRKAQLEMADEYSQARIQVENQVEAQRKDLENQWEYLMNEQQKLQSQLKIMKLDEVEEEAMKRDSLTKIDLWPSTQYRGKSSAEYHFRLAESQWLRMMGNQASSMTISKVVLIINPTLLRRFNALKEKLCREKKNFEERITFHGTATENLDAIAKNGFLIGGQGVKVAHGASFGHGVYSSEYPGVAMRYATHSGKSIMLLVRALVLEGDHVGKQDGDRINILVSRTVDQVYPQYEVHFSHANHTHTATNAGLTAISNANINSVLSSSRSARNLNPPVLVPPPGPPRNAMNPMPFATQAYPTNLSHFSFSAASEPD